MFSKIFDIFKPTIYREKQFVIKKIDDLKYSVASKNGLSATIDVSKRKIFINIFVKHELLTRYCHFVADNSIPMDLFVIESIKNNIIFKIQSCAFDSMVRNHYAILRGNNASLSFDTYYKNNGLKHSNSLEEWSGEFFEKNYYPHIIYSKKKVIENVHRYSFKAFNLYGGEYIARYYMIGDTLFSLSNLKEYLDIVSDTEPTGKLFSAGINNQLLDSLNIYEKNLNTQDILMLKRNKLNYCSIKKENKIITLIYLDNFNERVSEVNEDGQYRSSTMVCITWDKGKITTTKSFFNLDYAKEHELLVNGSVREKVEKFKLTHPSSNILKSLADIGLPHSLPLSADDLLVLEMTQI